MPTEEKTELMARLARVAIAADLQGIGFDPLIGRFAQLVGDDAKELFLGVDDQFSRLALQVSLGRAAGARASFLTAHEQLYPKQHSRLAVIDTRPARAALLELEARSGTDDIACALSSVGPERLGREVDRLSQLIDMEPNHRDRVLRIADALAVDERVDALTDRQLGADSRFELRFVHKNHTPDLSAAGVERIARAAEIAAVPEPQIEFVRAMHAEYAAGKPSLASVSSSG